MSNPTELSFLHDVREHRLIVLNDDKLNRHIRFSRPGTRCMQFDLITWPGYLCYTGDMGTYVRRAGAQDLHAPHRPLAHPGKD